MLSGAIAFQVYVNRLPTVRCVIVNKPAQKVIEEKGDHYYQLTDDKEAIIFTTDGMSVVSDSIE